MGFLEVLTIVFITLKLLGKIDWSYAYESLEDDIDNAPTIIPADKDGAE